jgi:hypothetical protein
MARAAHLLPLTAMAASCFEEKPDLLEDARGGWILRQGHVILSLQRHKAGAGTVRVRHRMAEPDPRAILGRVTQAMQRAGVPKEERDLFMNEATSGDYDHPYGPLRWPRHSHRLRLPVLLRTIGTARTRDLAAAGLPWPLGNLALTGHFENERCFRELRMTSSLDRLVKGRTWTTPKPKSKRYSHLQMM